MKALRFLALFGLASLATASAQIPQSIHHQGRIAVDGVNFDGTGQFKFLLYHGPAADTVSTALWKNNDADPANDAEPTAAIPAAVTKGLYAIALGQAPQAALPNLTPPTGQGLYLRIWFDDGANGSQQLSPDRAIVSVPFAKESARAASVADGSITAASLEPSLSIPNVQSGVYQTEVSAPWLIPSLPYTVTFATPFATPPVVTVSPTVDSSAPVYNVTTTSFSSTLDVPPGTWVTELVDSDGVGGRPCLASVAGFPAAVYESGTPALKFAINSSADGSGSWASSTISAEDVGNFSFAVVDGKPAVAYIAGSVVGGVLKFAINSAADGSGTWTTSVVDSASASDLIGDALAEVDGRPAIAYGDSANDDLRFAINASADGSGAWSLTTVDAVDNTGEDASLAVIDGRPAVAYKDSSTRSINFAINANADATGNWAISAVVTGFSTSSSNFAYLRPSLDILDGKPALSCQSSRFVFSTSTSTQQMWFCTNSAVDGSGTWTQTKVGTTLGALWSSMTVIDGLPLVCFTSEGGTSLAVDPSGTGAGPWNPAEIISSTGNPFITNIGGTPMAITPQGHIWRPQPIDIHWIAVGQ